MESPRASSALISGVSLKRQARVRLFDADGNLKEDLTGDERVIGADEFISSFQNDVEEPHELFGSGWQQVDTGHPIGAGQVAYRVAYKTFRIVPYPSIKMVWPNLQVTFQNGSINRGGMRAPEGIPGRGPRRHVIPEYGKVYNQGSAEPFYIRGLNSATINIGGWEKEIDAVSFVEIVYRIGDAPDGDYDALLRRGRRAIAPLTTLLDFVFGPRLLAMPLLEEVGEVFDDWHWNRKLHTGSLFVESQASLRQLQVHEITDNLAPLIEREQELPEEERRRLTLACLWYWRADADNEPTTKFVSWWLVAESLEMSDTNIIHVRRRLAVLFQTEEHYWSRLVGRLFGTRSRVVHGVDNDVAKIDLERVETLARVLLSARLLGEVPTKLRSELTQAAEIHNQQ